MKKKIVMCCQTKTEKVPRAVGCTNSYTQFVFNTGPPSYELRVKSIKMHKTEISYNQTFAQINQSGDEKKIVVS